MVLVTLPYSMLCFYIETQTFSQLKKKFGELLTLSPFSYFFESIWIKKLSLGGENQA